MKSKSNRILVKTFALTLAIVLAVAILYRFSMRKYGLTIGITAQEARMGDTVLIFGLLQSDRSPYIHEGITIELVSDVFPNSSKTTDAKGTYIFEGEVPNIPKGTYSFQTVAHTSEGDVFSDVVHMKVGDNYIPQSNSYISDFPTVRDDLYRPSLLIDNGEPKNRPPYHYNTWLIFMFGISTDGKYKIASSGGLDAETGRHLVIIIYDENNQKVHEQQMTPEFPFTITDKPPSPLPQYPTIHTNLNGQWIISQSIDEQAKKFYIRAWKNDGSIKLSIDTDPVDVVWWIGREQRNMLWMKTAGNDRMEVWGSFVSFHKFRSAVYERPEGKIVFNGIIGVDREWHFYVSGYKTPSGYAMGHDYSGFFGIQEDVTFAIWKGWDPWQNIVFSQQGIIYLANTNERYRFDTFSLRDTGGLFPTKYFLQGTFGGSGSINIEGTTIDFSHVYNPNPNEIFLRPIVLWNGVITTPDGSQITLQGTLGLGEEYRLV